ncbi:MAG: hypothetical protein DYG90_07415 [Chloroflexi bacterium CFX6]|nr:hypothetical protein [Chloroflexi bacterium CFX6]
MPDRGVAAPDPHGPAAADGWFDARDNHRSGLAWEKGWTGQGVRVGVADTGVDFATPELVGTWATVTDADSPYAGWPQALDSQGTYQYQQDLLLGSTGSQIGSGGVIQLVQSAPAVSIAGEPGFGAACFRRIRRPAAGQPVRIDPDETCGYKVPLTSRSGAYRFGPHPEPTLFTRYTGERPGLLLVDEAVAGTYDTVYVDLDNDRDFTDEKPVTRSSPLIYRDMDGDGHADISGGLLYWISDGLHPPPGMYLFAGDGGVPPPAQGTVVAILGPYGGNHGTLCASNVAGQGVLPVPAGIDLRFADLPGDGKPPYIHKGAAPGAAVVGIYRGGTLTSEAAYVYAAYGHDKDRPGDEVQVLSNSYPLRNVFEEGWDNASRLIDHLTTVNPELTFVFSTGNGGPGYGSLRDPHPRNAIKVAASTQMGSTGHDSITETAQIVYGDIIPFSSMGPAADGTQGPHVAADGAFASGATLVNGSANGTRTVVTWGGTSRSTPVAAGNLALIYQAYKARTGRWPTWREARSLLVAGAQPNGHDAFQTGAGYVDGARSAFIAGGLDGLYAQPDVVTPGDYRGTAYAGFPSLVRAGAPHRTTVTLTNPSPRPIAVTLAAKAPRRIGVHAFNWTSQNIGRETPYTANLPDYLIPVPEHLIPPGTELMAVRVQVPLEDSDLGLNYTTSTGGATPDNLWQLFVYNHTDHDDGCDPETAGMWHDRDDDGVVDKAVLQSSRQIDGIAEIDWANTELDRGEFIRFGQDTRAVNNLVVWVHSPLERMASGINIGLVHRTRPAARPTTTLSFQLEFYAYQDWDWVSFEADAVTVPAGGTLDVPVTVRAPADAGPGYHQGAIFATYPWTVPFSPAADPTDAGKRLFVPLTLQGFEVAAAPEPTPVPTATGGVVCGIQRWLRQARRAGRFAVPHPARLTIPVHVNVAADVAAGSATGLADAREQDKTQPYANAVVRGGNFWGYGSESGDWRYFFADVADDVAAGTRLVLRSRWEDGFATDDATGADVPRTDIDTLLYGPAPDRWTDPADPANATVNLADPTVFGPYGLAAIGGSTSTTTGSGVWPFQTATGGYEEWVNGPARPGLNLVMAHNVLVSGRSFDVPFELSLDQARLAPEAVAAAAAGCTPVAFTPSFAVEALSAEGFGLSPAESMADQPVTQDDAANELTAKWRKAFTVRHAASIDIVLDGQAGTDLDLYLYRDANGDGVPTRDEQVAVSGSPEPDEAIHAVAPADGPYIATVHGWSVPSPSTFDVDLLVVQGDGVRAEGLPDGGVAAGGTATLRVCYDPPDGAVPGTAYHGTVFFGPAQAARLFAIPVTVTLP